MTLCTYVCGNCTQNDSMSCDRKKTILLQHCYILFYNEGVKRMCKNIQFYSSIKNDTSTKCHL